MVFDAAAFGIEILVNVQYGWFDGLVLRCFTIFDQDNLWNVKMLDESLTKI